MKKLFLTAVILIAASTMLMAQPRAIGGRIGGWNIGPSYQHQIGEKNMIQADVDLIGWGLWGVQGTVTFNWLIPLVSVNTGELNLYPGVGLGGGYEWWYEGPYVIHWGYHPRYRTATTGTVGVAGMIGIEWNFNKIPLQLSFDYRPLIGISLRRIHYFDGAGSYKPDNIRADFYTHGLWSSAVAIGVRYKFGK